MEVPGFSIPEIVKILAKCDKIRRAFRDPHENLPRQLQAFRGEVETLGDFLNPRQRNERESAVLERLRGTLEECRAYLSKNEHVTKNSADLDMVGKVRRLHQIIRSAFGENLERYRVRLDQGRQELILTYVAPSPGTPARDHSGERKLSLDSPLSYIDSAQQSLPDTRPTPDDLLEHDIMKLVRTLWRDWRAGTQSAPHGQQMQLEAATRELVDSIRRRIGFVEFTKLCTYLSYIGLNTHGLRSHEDVLQQLPLQLRKMNCNGDPCSTPPPAAVRKVASSMHIGPRSDGTKIDIEIDTNKVLKAVKYQMIMSGETKTLYWWNEAGKLILEHSFESSTTDHIPYVWHRAYADKVDCVGFQSKQDLVQCKEGNRKKSRRLPRYHFEAAGPSKQFQADFRGKIWIETYHLDEIELNNILLGRSRLKESPKDHFLLRNECIQLWQNQDGNQDVTMTFLWQKHIVKLEKMVEVPLRLLVRVYPAANEETRVVRLDIRRSSCTPKAAGKQPEGSRSLSSVSSDLDGPLASKNVLPGADWIKLVFATNAEASKFLAIFSSVSRRDSSQASSLMGSPPGLTYSPRIQSPSASGNVSTPRETHAEPMTTLPVSAIDQNNLPGATEVLVADSLSMIFQSAPADVLPHKPLPLLDLGPAANTEGA